MDEQMIEIARAICRVHGQEPDDEAPLYEICGPNNEPVPWWRFYEEDAAAAHSVIAGKVAELEGALKRLIADSVTVAGLCDLLIPGTQIFDAIEQARAALAPYPERRSEPHD